MSAIELIRGAGTSHTAGNVQREGGGKEEIHTKEMVSKKEGGRVDEWTTM